MAFTQQDSAERWDRNATQWHEHFGEKDPTRRYLLDPIILELLGNPAGMRVLDAGCGEGYLCRKLARLGAQVTGVEISGRMLSYAIAEQERAPLTITYHHADIASLEFLRDRSLDAVVTDCVLQDAEHFAGAFQEFSRLLRSGGSYLFIDNHPCFSPPENGWVRDDQGTRLYRRVDHYFRRGPHLARWRSELGMEPSISWHRTLGDYVNALIASGFVIRRVIEPEPTEEWLADYPTAAEGDSRIPDFLVLLCQKP